VEWLPGSLKGICDLVIKSMFDGVSSSSASETLLAHFVPYTKRHSSFHALFPYLSGDIRPIFDPFILAKIIVKRPGHIYPWYASAGSRWGKTITVSPDTRQPLTGASAKNDYRKSARTIQNAFRWTNSGSKCLKITAYRAITNTVSSYFQVHFETGRI